MPGAVDFAVNQQSEQIIFEVEPDGHVVAHVLIRYAGDPEQFAWIVPVPSLPELELSHPDAFGLIDQQSAPQITVTNTNACPTPLYVCRRHPQPSCGGGAGLSGGTAGNFAGAPTSGAAGTGASAAPDAPAVIVYARQQIGSYDTVVFGAGDAQGAVDWLQGEGFIVNDTMSPYMQPYLDDNMLFVAAKLVPGADADEIRPLRMRYEGTQPMIPLQLTAVATEPNLTVTAYIYGESPYAPLDQALLLPSDIPDDALGGDATRSNYPMVLARLFDEEGGRAFMLEYAGLPPRFRPVPLNQSGPFPIAGTSGGGAFDDCCDASDGGGDPCGILHDGQCQCPLSPGDADDCGQEEDLVAGVRLVEELATKYPSMTRITTRLSADEMTFDPMFAPDASIAPMRLARTAQNQSLASCMTDVLEGDRYDELRAISGCATTYCGRGRCVATDSGVGCECDPGQVARQYADLDGLPSVTCVPDTPPVDLEAGGLVVPDICETLSSLEDASCVNLAGFAGIACDDGNAAVLVGTGVAPVCRPVTFDSGNSGARNYSLELLDVRICAPRPPPCDHTSGWLEELTTVQRPSVERCDSSSADRSWLEIPPKPTCPAPSTAGTGGFTPTTPPDVQADTTQPRPSTRTRDADGLCAVRAPGVGDRGAVSAWLLFAAIALGRLGGRARWDGAARLARARH